MTDLKELVDQGKAHARRILIERREKELVPFYHLVIPGDKDAVIAAPWQNEIQKQLIVYAVKDAAHRLGATAAMFIGEAWMLQLKKHEGETLDMAKLPKPSQHPDRIEVVQIVATDGPNTRAEALQIKRDARGRVTALEDLGLPDNGNWLQGRLIDGIIPVTKH